MHCSVYNSILSHKGEKKFFSRIAMKKCIKSILNTSVRKAVSLHACVRLRLHCFPELECLKLT